MSLYVDSSALLKRYVEEPESEICERHLLANPVWVTARHTLVEIRRNLARLLDGTALQAAISAFDEDWSRMRVVELDEATCALAAEIAESSGARSLDALHIAAAVRVGAAGLTFLTYDVRQAQAARRMGLSIVGI